MNTGVAKMVEFWSDSKRRKYLETNSYGYCPFHG